MQTGCLNSNASSFGDDPEKITGFESGPLAWSDFCKQYLSENHLKTITGEKRTKIIDA